MQCYYILIYYVTRIEKNNLQKLIFISQKVGYKS